MGVACCTMKEQLELLSAQSAATLGLSSLGSQEPRLPPGGRFTVMMFGMTGSGKSALGNLLAGYDHFLSGDDTASVTNNQSVLKYESPDKSLVVLDTIGLGDTELDQDKVVASIRDCALSAPRGVDAMVFVMRSGRITDDVIARLIYATEYLWGTDCLLNLYIVVTYASRYVTQREEALAWIERQNEINWRFRHIYGLVGRNENRILFVDNPDPADGEPLTRLRRHNSKQNVMKAFVQHPRDIIPPFTHAMMKKAQERMETTLKEVQKAEEALNELQAKAAESNLDVEKEMAEAKERKRKAEEAHKQEMKQIQEDVDFRRMAAQAVEEATVAFGKKYETAEKGEESVSTVASPSEVMTSPKGSNPVEACKRVFRALRRFVKPRLGGTPAALPASPKGDVKVVEKQRLTPEEVEAMVEEAHLRLLRSEKKAPQELMESLDQQGLKFLTPVQFQMWVKKVSPEIKQAQLAGIWRRADTNCDGKISEEEFFRFLAYKR